MGLPTTAAYIVTATTIAPALIGLGLAPLSAHLFLFYFASISCITPPVAVASYAGAGLADASPSKVGWEAVRLGFIAFIIPFAFVMSPALIHFDMSNVGTGILTIFSVLTTFLAGLPLAWAVQGYSFHKLNPLWRLAFLALGFSQLFPQWYVFLPGAAIILGLWWWQRNNYYRKGMVTSKGS